MTGELDSLRKRLEEVEAKCKTEFDCTVEQLPQLIADFDTEAEKSLSNAETILGIKQSESDEDAPV